MPPKPAAVLKTDALEGSLGYTLRRAQLSTYREFDESMAKFDIRPSQYAVLVLIRSNPGVSQSAVGAALGIQKTNFVGVIDRLEKRGLTERRKTPGDRRSSALYLTRAGERFCERMEAAHAVHEERLAERLGPKRTKQFMELLYDFLQGDQTPE